MFEITFLGAYGWLLEHSGSRLLVDPLFGDDFSHVRGTGLVVHPPRELDLTRMPRADAIFLTHEHEGHLDLPTLARLDRTIPVYIPARSSTALRRILGELGYAVHLLEPGDIVEIGTLRLALLTGDQTRPEAVEEWDNLPYLVWDADGHGSFFSHVDVRVDAPMVDAVARHQVRPGVWVHTGNDHFHEFSYQGARSSSEPLRRRVGRIVEVEELLAARGITPALSLLMPGGFAFDEARGWLNHNAFLYVGEDVLGAARALLPGHPLDLLPPGRRVGMRDGVLVSDRPNVPWVTQRGPGPDRRFRGDVPFLEDYTPATGRTALRPAEAEALRVELQHFAAFLYGRRIFRQLCSLAQGRPEGRSPTFAIVARDGEEGDAWVYAYDLSACAFVAVNEPDPVGRYLAVYECWASDLLAVLQVRASQDILGFGRHRCWNAIPGSLDFDLHADLYTFAHPMRLPDRFLRFYRSLLREEAVLGVSGARVGECRLVTTVSKSSSPTPLSART